MTLAVDGPLSNKQTKLIIIGPSHHDHGRLSMVLYVKGDFGSYTHTDTHNHIGAVLVPTWLVGSVLIYMEEHLLGLFTHTHSNVCSYWVRPKMIIEC